MLQKQHFTYACKTCVKRVYNSCYSVAETCALIWESSRVGWAARAKLIYYTGFYPRVYFYSQRKTFAHAACKTFEHAFSKRRVKLYPRACKTLGMHLQYFTYASVKLRPAGMILPTRVKFYQVCMCKTWPACKMYTHAREKNHAGKRVYPRSNAKWPAGKI